MIQSCIVSDIIATGVFLLNVALRVALLLIVTSLTPLFLTSVAL